jgi:23S rRNA (pseudouridine1915-N3)-methyltransferase
LEWGGEVGKSGGRNELRLDLWVKGQRSKVKGQRSKVKVIKLRIVAIGKIKSKPIRELTEDYAARIKHYFPIDCIDVKDEQSTLKSLKEGDLLVVCDERGDEKSSEELAGFIETCQKSSVRNLIFFIGGPEGIQKELKQKADKLLSLSKMTLPHELAQAILLEQIYRACTILRGEKYHK